MEVCIRFILLNGDDHDYLYIYRDDNGYFVRVTTTILHRFKERVRNQWPIFLTDVLYQSIRHLDIFSTKSNSQMSHYAMERLLLTGIEVCDWVMILTEILKDYPIQKLRTQDILLYSMYGVLLYFLHLKFLYMSIRKIG